MFATICRLVSDAREHRAVGQRICALVGEPHRKVEITHEFFALPHFGNVSRIQHSYAAQIGAYQVKAHHLGHEDLVEVEIHQIDSGRSLELSGRRARLIYDILKARYESSQQHHHTDGAFFHAAPGFSQPKWFIDGARDLMRQIEEDVRKNHVPLSVESIGVGSVSSYRDLPAIGIQYAPIVALRDIENDRSTLCHVVLVRNFPYVAGEQCSMLFVAADVVPIKYEQRFPCISYKMADIFRHIEG